MSTPSPSLARLWLALAMALLMVPALVAVPTPASAQLDDTPAPTNLQVVQGDGYTTLTWDAVEDAEEYEIERVEVTEDDTAVGAPVIVGVWRANRQTPGTEVPTFADAGFTLGTRYRWRVRVAPPLSLPVSLPLELPTDPPFSEPVFATTNAEFGDPDVEGQNQRTGWEQTLAAQYTSDTEEYAYTAALAAASDRVDVVEIGRTRQNRPINMFVINIDGPRTAAEISDSPAAMVNCNVHGNEPSSREACLILARELAFADDARTVDILSNVTVLIVPAINGDGRAANSRGNAEGQDLNRDHSKLSQPETQALAEAVRDYSPAAAFDGHEYGNSSTGDLPVMIPRHLNVAQPIWDGGKAFMEGVLYTEGSADGWWYCPYGCEGGGGVGASQETILRNTLGLKNTLAFLVEARSSGGSTRPDETNTQHNRRRKTYSALYTYQLYLDWFRANTEAIEQTVTDAVAFQESNSGEIVWRGSRPLEPFPAPHPGESPPNDEPATGGLETPPCAYDLTAAQYTTAPPNDGPGDGNPSVAERMTSHGWTVQAQTDGSYRVPLAQAHRGLIPLLLDGEATEPWLSAERVFDCS